MITAQRLQSGSEYSIFGEFLSHESFVQSFATSCNRCDFVFVAYDDRYSQQLYSTPSAEFPARRARYFNEFPWFFEKLNVYRKKKMIHKYSNSVFYR